MKKTVVLLLCLLTLSACGNKNIGLGNYDYYYITCESSYISLRNEPIESWKDSSDGEQVEVTLVEGNKLLVSANRCILSRDLIGKYD